ncbi:glucosidase family protein [Picrophilus oshimae]|uniref:Glycogen debranching enzyme (Alpha-1,6-glucosidase) n=1 Tax=Picrophilus torridus (strain ATCC 700027 / DSM 9790 / JCM 10055 / NBRC 100828 / KAW 2/3) TaxID=1122961 RepID=A0A8G2FW14_PICTO|nr:amylo-alpha-1,6-glucosidase [Picrophilus oshimae]SMD30530.1 Glycogen debranching enzyme (alpha-1,6-glucosidase) [Picrophilus oshimae DSM 9789]
MRIIGDYKPNHKPYTISSMKAYFTGFLDLMPDSIGYHIPGNMNGLWFPPVRALKNVYILNGNEIVKPKRVILYSSGIEFHNDDLLLKFWFDKNSIFRIKINSMKNYNIELIMELMPLNTWFSINDTRILEKKHLITISSQMFTDTRIKIRTGNPFILKDGILKIDVKKSSEVEIYNYFNINNKIPVNNYSDINRFSVLKSEGNMPRNFTMAKENLIRLSMIIPGIGYGLTAGQPDFPWYFGIDSMLSINGMLYSGFFNLARGSLNILARFSRSGKIPHEILQSGKIYNDGDLEETALYPYAVFRYIKFSWNLKENLHLIKTAGESFNYIMEHGYSGRGIMEDPGAGSGIDIDTITFTIMSLKELMDFKNCDSEEILNMIDVLNPGEKIDGLKKIINNFWLNEKKTFANRIIDNTPYDHGFWTSILPFYSNLATNNQYRMFADYNGGLSSMKSDSGIMIDRSGNTMPLNTGMFLIAAAAYEDSENALYCLEKLNNSFERFSPGSCPEISNNSHGCFLQAWSGSLYIESIASGIFGIKIENGKPVSSPLKNHGLGHARLEKLRFGSVLYNFNLY